MAHKHASVLRDIADGVPLSEFEIEWIHGTEENAGFKNATFQNLIDAIQFPEHWEIRRKPQYIMVNGFKVPKPLDAVPNSRVYTPSLMNDSDTELHTYWDFIQDREIAVQRGIAHGTEEAAIAHAKAMLGIDPKWEE